MIVVVYETKTTIGEKDSVVTGEKNCNFNESLFYKNQKNLVDKITKHFDYHISACKIKEAYGEILQVDNFSFKMVFQEGSQKSSFEIKLKKVFHLCWHRCNYLIHVKYLTNTINNSLKYKEIKD